MTSRQPTPIHETHLPLSISEEDFASIVEQAMDMIGSMGLPIVPSLFANAVAEVIYRHYEVVRKPEERRI